MADETIKTLVKVPDDAIIVEVVEVVSYIDRETADRCWSFRMEGDTPVSSTVGLLRMVEHRVLAKYVGNGQGN